ncbi:unnamed protein product [Parnassius apollo]|uniref:(apollo) hypothetical protein n=1 Tax=Parnassius apollo TaxID=110799 RepID=A0A8S3WLG9_PARAO|nr:unnamed protein product [Parnassius apollo]
MSAKTSRLYITLDHTVEPIKGSPLGNRDTVVLATVTQITTRTYTRSKMFKLTILLALIAFTQAGIIAPVVPVAHPVVAHHVIAHPVVHHRTLVPAAPIVHAPVVHAAPIVPVVKHAPVIAVHH